MDKHSFRFQSGRSWQMFAHSCRFLLNSLGIASQEAPVALRALQKLQQRRSIEFDWAACLPILATAEVPVGVKAAAEQVIPLQWTERPFEGGRSLPTAGSLHALPVCVPYGWGRLGSWFAQ